MRRFDCVDSADEPKETLLETVRIIEARVRVNKAIRIILEKWEEGN